MSTSSVSSSCSVPLGHPLPLDEHACSVSLPTWASVVGYEEGDARVSSKLACGYPRFVYHPYVLKLMEAALELDAERRRDEGAWDCLVLPSARSAVQCHDFLAKATSMSTALFATDNAIDPPKLSCDHYRPDARIRIVQLPAEVHAVVFPAETSAAIEAKSYWQHTGDMVSSRRAEAALHQLGKIQSLPRVTSPFYDDTNDTDNNTDGWTLCPHTGPHLALYPSQHSHTTQSYREQIKQRITGIISAPDAHQNAPDTDFSSSVFLTPSGMASIYAALRSARRRKLFATNKKGGDGGRAIVYGFPYLDTLKMCSRPELVPGGVEFFGHGHARDLNALQNVLYTRAHSSPDNDAGICALITEFPSNPLLQCHDLYALRSLADQYDFALIVDDTIGNFCNLNLLHSGLADAVCTSLTKLFNGRGDAMAGSIVTNPLTRIGRTMTSDLQQHHSDEDLWEGDAAAISHNSIDFVERNDRINETTERLADWFHDHDDVQHVYYPKFTCPDMYHRIIRKGGGGYGGLLSIVLYSHVCQRTFYDTLDVCKGPSLGTNFTLVSPYTLLAHYHELDFATSYHVSPNLLRIAVGLEEYPILKKKFETAFCASRLHPKIPTKDSSLRTYCTTTTMNGRNTMYGSKFEMEKTSSSRVNNGGTAASSLLLRSGGAKYGSSRFCSTDACRTVEETTMKHFLVNGLVATTFRRPNSLAVLRRHVMRRR